MPPVTEGGRRRIAIIGSTESIGTSAIEVIRQHGDRFEVVVLAAGGNRTLLSQQADELKPRYLFLQQTEQRRALREQFAGKCTVFDSSDELHAVLNREQVDLVLAAVVGFDGLGSVVAALNGGCSVALANKESLVSAGELISRLVSEHRAPLVPVDSEHSAIFQALQGERHQDISELVLTASGGPFFGYTRAQLASITPEQALKHPTWRMGAKITVDSATMVNKSLELAEARWLFDVAPEKISVLVHRQSIVHSLVNFQDGSSIAQLGVPDMKVAIAYALNYPHGRLSAIAPTLDLARIGKLDFFPLDDDTFRAPQLMRNCLKQGGVAPAVFTIANDIAVARFLKGELSFEGIVAMIEAALERHGAGGYDSLSDLLTLRDRIYADREILV